MCPHGHVHNVKEYRMQTRLDFFKNFQDVRTIYRCAHVLVHVHACLITHHSSNFLPVKAFMKVAKERFVILKKGSLTGYLEEPQRVVCSRIWATPVLSIGVVRKPTLEKKHRSTCTCIYSAFKSLPFALNTCS